MSELFDTEQARLDKAADTALATQCLATLGIAATEMLDPTASRALNKADKLTGPERALPRELSCKLGECSIRLETAAQGALITPIGCDFHKQSL